MKQPSDAHDSWLAETLTTQEVSSFLDQQRGDPDSAQWVADHEVIATALRRMFQPPEMVLASGNSGRLVRFRLPPYAAAAVLLAVGLGIVLGRDPGDRIPSAGMDGALRTVMSAGPGDPLGRALATGPRSLVPVMACTVEDFPAAARRITGEEVEVPPGIFPLGPLGKEPRSLVGIVTNEHDLGAHWIVVMPKKRVGMGRLPAGPGVNGWRRDLGNLTWFEMGPGAEPQVLPLLRPR